jgi:glutamyl-tRNA reductase
MHLLCVGISHQTASVELRERVAMSPEVVDQTLANLRAEWPQAEVAILSTCNRTEFYVARPLHGHPRAEALSAMFVRLSGQPAEALAPALYTLDNEKALTHAMRVAAGLDSMVLGENQVLGQVREAYEQAQRRGTIGRTLHRVFQSTLAAAKRVRTETKIGEGRTSVSSAAVDFARHLFHRFDDKSLLTIGAGKMTELTLKHFMELGPRRLQVCNRTPGRAAELAAKFGGTAHALTELEELLVEADLVISSTGATEPIMTAARFKPLMKRRRFRPIFVIDIAVPRDFDPAIGQMSNVYLYDMDDLQRAIADQRELRSGEVVRGESIIAESVRDCYAAIQTGDFNELIARLRTQLHELGAAENQRTAGRLRGADAAAVQKILEEHTHRLVNKILHRPLSELGRNGAADAAMNATALRRLFDLGDDEDLNPPEPNERKPTAE